MLLDMQQQAANRSEAVLAAAVVIAVAVGIVIAWAGSQDGQTVAGIPVFALGVALAFIIQWAVFVPSYLRQTERYFDLTGSISYITVAILAFVLSPERDSRSLVLVVLVVIWAGRLGTYLFRRIRKSGKDDRFDDLKTSPVRFLAVWTMQGLWVSLTLAAALAAITTTNRDPLGFIAGLGLVVWIVGFAIEAVADLQKNRWNADPDTRGQFIHTGLWAWSRHPNYFGEIVLWTGVAIIALPVLTGWQYLTLISPFFVAFLLMRISGVPMLEQKADRKWGGQPDYEAYKARTPVLIPRPPRRD